MRLENEGWNELIYFLGHQRQLSNLTLIDNQRIPEDLKIIPMKPDLRINTLNLLLLRNMNFQRLIDFLMLLTNSVNYLSVIRVEKNLVSEMIFRAVLSNFKTLQGLAVDFDHFPTSASFYQTLDVNRTLKSLALSSKFLNNPAGFRGIFRTYPAVKNLSLSISTMSENMQAEDFEFMFEKLKELKSFYLVVPSSNYLIQGIFRNITSLIILNCNAPVNWAHVAESSPNLKRLNISTTPCTGMVNFSSVLTHLHKLNELELGEGFRMTTTHIKIIKEKAISLTSLKLLKTSWRIKAGPLEILRAYNIRDFKIVLQAKFCRGYESVFLFRWA